MGEEDEGRDEKEEDRDQDEAPSVRGCQIFHFSNQIGGNKQTDARAGRDDPES